MGTSDSNKILEDLAANLQSYSQEITLVKPYVILPDVLVAREDTPRERIGISEVSPVSDLTTGAFVVRDVVQRYEVQIFLRYAAGLGDEEILESRVNDLKDLVIGWAAARAGSIGSVNSDLHTFSYDPTQERDIERGDGYYQKILGISAKRTLIT